jgi:hypothetical protein
VRKFPYNAHIVKILSVCLAGSFHNPWQELQHRMVDDAAETGAADKTFSNMPVPVSM